MKIRFIPAGITLSAGAVTCLICIMKNYDVLYSLQALLIVLIIFSYIGIKAQKIIISVMREQRLQEEEAIRLAEWKEAERLRKLEEEKNAEAFSEETAEDTEEIKNDQDK